MKKWIFIGVCFPVCMIRAQIAPIGSLGLQATQEGKGLLLETKSFRFGTLFNEANAVQPFQEFKLEYRYAFQQKKISYGTRYAGIRGWSIFPQIAGGIMTRREEDNVTKKLVADYGIVLTPSINIAIPFGVIELGGQTQFLFKGNTTREKFNFVPTLGIRLDGLFEMLDPEMTNTGKYGSFVTTKVGETRSTSDNGYQKTTRITSYYKTEYKEYDYYYKSINAFHGLTPRYTVSNRPFAGKSQMLGLGYFYRFKQNCLDVIVENGTHGYASEMNDQVFIQNVENKENRINKDANRFIAEGRQTRIYARFGYDVHHMLKRFFSGAFTANLDKPTPAFRVLGGLGFGYAFVEKPRFVNEGADQLKDEQFKNAPDLWRNPINDVRRTKSGWMYHAFLTVEYGVVSLECSYSILLNSPLSRGGINMGVSYTLPLSLMKKHYQEYKNK